MFVLLFGVCVLGGFLYVVGAAVKAAAKPLLRRRNTVVGAAKVGAWTRAAWRGRAVLVTGGAWLTLAIAAFAVIVSLRMYPDDRMSIILVGIVGILSGLTAWLWVVTGDRPLKEVADEVRRINEMRAAIQVINPAAKPGKVQIGKARTVIPVSHVGAVDFEGVGQMLHVPHTSFEPGAVMGRGNLIVHDRVPEPEPDVWEALKVVHRWPGPWSQEPGADVPVGVDPFGRVVFLPYPGSGGKHLLIGGSTGAGKSVFLSVVLAELAYRPHTRFMLGDPKWVELALFEPRAARLAKGAAATGKLLDEVYAEMMARYKALEKVRRRQFIVGEDGDQILLVIEELAEVTSGAGSGPRIDALSQILAMGRAAGVGLIGCSQRPSYKLIPTHIRSNFRSRVGLGCEDDDQTDAIMGTRRWPCHEIPTSLQGAAYVRIDREAVACRSYLLEDDDLERVAASTAHLKGA